MQRILIVLLAVGFTILIYSNSFKGAWQYDDVTNIVENDAVHLTALTWNGLKHAIYASPISGKTHIQRPLAFLSFALNYRMGGLNVCGFHLVNLLVHVTSAVILFKFILLVLRAPLLVNRYGEHAFMVAFVSSVVWATHPIQVTAVTYIVQRMASMAALFAIVSLFAFLKGRLAARPLTQYSWYAASLVAYLAAVATKENAIVIPACMLVMEIIIIQGGWRYSFKRWIKTLGVVTILVGFVVGAVLYWGDISLPTSFENRPYTPLQRLLTQPRVLVSYLFWIAIPMRSHLTLLHDIQFSRNLIDPLTTLPAMLVVLGGGIVLAVISRRHPLTAFCGLFFLINHAVEASFLNLGLCYEHRNYLPSMLVFVPPSAWLIHFVRRSGLSKGLRMACMTAVGIFIISNGHSVYSYNTVFFSEWSLWFDVLLKSPMLSIAQNNLGKVLWDIGAYEKANQKFNFAMRINRFDDYKHKGLVHHNLGLYQTYVAKNYHCALIHFKKALETANGNPSTWYHLGRVYLLLCRFEEAEKIFRNALLYWPKEIGLILGMAVTQLESGKLDAALQWVERAECLSPQNQKIGIVKAVTYSRMSNIGRARFYFHDYLVSNPQNRSKVAELSEIERRGGSSESIARLLLELSGVDEIFMWPSFE